MWRWKRSDADKERKYNLDEWYIHRSRGEENRRMRLKKRKVNGHP